VAPCCRWLPLDSGSEVRAGVTRHGELSPRTGIPRLRLVPRGTFLDPRTCAEQQMARRHRVSDGDFWCSIAVTTILVLVIPGLAYPAFGLSMLAVVIAILLSVLVFAWRLRRATQRLLGAAPGDMSGQPPPEDWLPILPPRGGPGSGRGPSAPAAPVPKPLRRLSVISRGASRPERERESAVAGTATTP
jgi:hypothetical protein